VAGRPSKPVDLIVLEGKSHRTKEELNARRAAEAEMRVEGELKASKAVRASSIALAEFKRLKALYEGIAFVGALDQAILNRYCLALAMLEDLRGTARQMQDHLDALSEEGNELDAQTLCALYRSIASVIGKIQAQEKQLRAYEDRLLLTPAGRIRAVPKKPPEKEKAESGFMAYREKWHKT
jgi:phage terminase small subunit